MRAKSRLDGLLVAQEEARALDVASTTRLTEATAANAAAEDTLRKFSPLWSEAERLDTELATARIELNDATEKSQRAKATLRDQEDALAAIDQALGQTTELHGAKTAQLSSQSDRLPLVDRLNDAMDLLAKRHTLKQDHATATSEAVRTEEAAARLQAEIAELSGNLTTDRGRKDGFNRDIADRRASLAKIDEPALHKRDRALQDALESLREASVTCEQHVRATADLAHGESELVSALQEVRTANGQIVAAESDQLRDRTARAEIVPLAELADEAVSQEAIHLRSLLISNSACPVCGSTEHPHLDHPSALNEIGDGASPSPRRVG